MHFSMAPFSFRRASSTPTLADHTRKEKVLPNIWWPNLNSQSYTWFGKVNIGFQEVTYSFAWFSLLTFFTFSTARRALEIRKSTPLSVNRDPTFGQSWCPSTNEAKENTHRKPGRPRGSWGAWVTWITLSRVKGNCYKSILSRLIHTFTLLRSQFDCNRGWGWMECKGGGMVSKQLSLSVRPKDTPSRCPRVAGCFP